MSPPTAMGKRASMSTPEFLPPRQQHKPIERLPSDASDAGDVLAVMCAGVLSPRHGVNTGGAVP